MYKISSANNNLTKLPETGNGAEIDLKISTCKSVTDMNYMFRGASNFSQDLSNWNLSTSLTVANMFEGSVAPHADTPTIKNNKLEKSVTFSSRTLLGAAIKDWFTDKSATEVKYGKIDTWSISFNDGLDWPNTIPIDTDITQGCDITIPSGKTLEISSYVEGGGGDGAEPEPEAEPDAEPEAEADVVRRNTLTILESKKIIFESGSTLINNGNLIFEHNSFFDNKGVIKNSGTIRGAGTFENDGDIHNVTKDSKLEAINNPDGDQYNGWMNKGLIVNNGKLINNRENTGGWGWMNKDFAVVISNSAFEGDGSVKGINKDSSKLYLPDSDGIITFNEQIELFYSFTIPSGITLNINGGLYIKDGVELNNEGVLQVLDTGVLVDSNQSESGGLTGDGSWIKSGILLTNVPDSAIANSWGNIVKSNVTLFKNVGIPNADITINTNCTLKLDKDATYNNGNRTININSNATLILEGELKTTGTINNNGILYSNYNLSHVDALGDANSTTTFYPNSYRKFIIGQNFPITLNIDYAFDALASVDFNGQIFTISSGKTLINNTPVINSGSTGEIVNHGTLFSIYNMESLGFTSNSTNTFFPTTDGVFTVGTDFPTSLTTNFKLFNFNNLVVPNGTNFTIDSNAKLDNYGLILNNSGKEKFVINGILPRSKDAIFRISTPISTK